MLHFLQTLRDEVVDRADEIVDTVKANPVLLAVLAVIGVITALVFLFGVVRQAFKAALFGGLLSAGAWYWYFSIR
jgi:hypothetical protein